MIDLEKDLDMLELYTAFMTKRNLLLLADHYENIYEGRFIAYCKSCIEKHLELLQHYPSECLEGGCRPEELWRDIAEWATKAGEYTDRLGKKDKKTLELSQEARLFRKKVEEIMNNAIARLREKGVDVDALLKKMRGEEDTQEHLT